MSFAGYHQNGRGVVAGHGRAVSPRSTTTPRTHSQAARNALRHSGQRNLIC